MVSLIRFVGLERKRLSSHRLSPYLMSIRGESFEILNVFVNADANSPNVFNLLVAAFFTYAIKSNKIAFFYHQWELI